ncbi:MAG: hypothetical protein AB1721_01020 [Patescibacteria group bacterium]
MTLISKPILLVLLGLFLVSGSFYLGLNFDELKTNFLSKNKACTLEMMACPDGTMVGRVGPNCEFAPCPGPKSLPPGSLGQNFTGVITNITYDCHFDGICSVQVDNSKEVIVGRGEGPLPEEQGRLIDFVLDERKEKSYWGKPVEVFAQKISEGNYTLYGSTNYYLKLLSVSQAENCYSELVKSFVPGVLLPNLSGKFCQCMDGQVINGDSCQTEEGTYSLWEYFDLKNPFDNLFSQTPVGEEKRSEFCQLNPKSIYCRK